MGCPAKKVCNVMAGSALLTDEPLVARILEAVVAAVDVPVTLKIRTGWAPSTATRCASRASPRSAGIQLLAIHGRTRACGFAGAGRVRHHRRGQARRAPAGDRQRRHHHAGGGASACSSYTGADGIMIGRAAQGRPWIFREIEHYLDDRRAAAAAAPAEIQRVLARAPGGPVRVLRRGARRAHRAQAHRLVHARAAGRRRLSASAMVRIADRGAREQLRRGRTTISRRLAGMSRSNELADARQALAGALLQGPGRRAAARDLRHGAEERREAHDRAGARPAPRATRRWPPRCSASTATPCARRSSSCGSKA